jgi:hypothetical protein
MGQGEAQHRKYKRLKLGGGETYDRYNLDRYSATFYTDGTSCFNNGS